MSRRGSVLLVACLVTLLAPPAVETSAQGGIIRIIVGTAPGGAIDPYARMVGEHMSRTLGQPIIVENKPGASGTLAAEYIVNAPADGTILWLGTQAFTEINPNAFPNARWSIDQFRPIIRGVEAPLAFVINPSVPADTFADFIAWAKANRGKLSYSSYQAGTPSHFLGFQMNEKFELDLTHVPTFAELGYAEFTAKVWFGLLVREGVPDDVFGRLTEAAKAAHADPTVREKLEAQGFEVSGETGPQLKAQIKQQIERWGRLVKASGFSIEDRGSTR